MWIPAFDQTQVSVQHMLGVHSGKFTSLWGRLLQQQQQNCYDRQSLRNTTRMVVGCLGRGICRR